MLGRSVTIIMEGFLEKQSDWLGSWRRRYFRLFDHHLAYFLSPSSRVARGVLVFHEADIVRPPTKTSGNLDNPGLTGLIFSVRTRRRQSPSPRSEVWPRLQRGVRRAPARGIGQNMTSLRPVRALGWCGVRRRAGCGGRCVEG